MSEEIIIWCTCQQCSTLFSVTMTEYDSDDRDLSDYCQDCRPRRLAPGEPDYRTFCECGCEDGLYQAALDAFERGEDWRA